MGGGTRRGGEKKRNQWIKGWCDVQSKGHRTAVFTSITVYWNAVQKLVVNQRLSSGREGKVRTTGRGSGDEMRRTKHMSYSHTNAIIL